MYHSYVFYDIYLKELLWAHLKYNFILIFHIGIYNVKINKNKNIIKNNGR